MFKLPSVLTGVSIAKKHHNHGNSYTGKHLTEVSLQFRVLIHCYHGWEHGSMQAEMVPEMELRVLYLDGSTGDRRDKDTAWLVQLKLQSTPQCP